MMIIIISCAILTTRISINLNALRPRQKWQLEIADKNVGFNGKAATGGFSCNQVLDLPEDNMHSQFILG